MDHYFDIRIRPDPEFTTAHLLNALGGKLHLALVNLRSQDIGVSFPKFQLAPPTLGDVLRLHGRRQRLAELRELNWLTGMIDHIAIGELLSAPNVTTHRIVRRVQAQSSAERVRRRQMKRHQWTEEEAHARIPDSIEQKLRLPYLSLRSQSTGQPFRLFIDHQAPQDAPVIGGFNAYGLSSSATIPWF